MKKILKIIFGRVTFIAIAAIIEILIVVGLLHWFGEKVAWIEVVLRALSVVIVLFLVNNSSHLSSDMIWILAIVLMPVAGTVAYLLIGANMLTSRTLRNIIVKTEYAKQYYRQDPEVMRDACQAALANAGQLRYISGQAGFPIYRNEGFDYYGLADEGYPVMLEEMKKAQKFIFLEYFIIEEGKMWNGMLEILREKARQGLDVRVMYDDFGSFMTLSADYAKKLEADGVKCVPFNRINPVIGIIMNHRDHRKLMVIDGKIAFSGGANLADEYINEIKRFGHWKDNIIRIKGEAVWSYTVMFLTHWSAISQTQEDFERFHVASVSSAFDGYIAPYGEVPLYPEITAQNVYMNILNQATDYCYIMTPYLIIDTELSNALLLCAKRGVDVRIITPGVPDKKLIWQITRSFYPKLINGGVKIYEYTPGFVHSKVFVADDMIAVVGTINLDYRSLYLHFENGTYLFGAKAVKDVKDDCLKTLGQSKLISQGDIRQGPLKALFISFVKLFASQM